MNYIDIQEQPKQFATKTSSTAEIGKGIAGTLSNTAQTIIQQISQQDKNNKQVEVNNKIQDAFTQIQINTSDFKKNNALNPNDIKANESFMSSIEAIGENIANSIPTGYKNDFLNKFIELKNTTKNNLELWKYSQTEQNYKANTESQINSLYKQATIFGEENNIQEAVNSFAINSKIIYDNAKLKLGEPVAKALTQDLVKDYYTNYLNGVLTSTPEQIPAIIEDKNNNIKNIIGAKATEDFLNKATTKIKNFKDYNVYKETAELMTKEKYLMTEISKENVDYLTLHNFFAENEVSKATQDYLTKIAGYGNNGSKKKNISLDEKYKAKNLILEQITRMSIEPETVEVDKLKTLQDTVFQYGNDGYLTQDEVRNYLNQIDIYNAEILEKNTLDKYNSSRFFGKDYGAEQIQDFITKISKEDYNKKTYNKNDGNIARLKTTLYTDYIENVNQGLINLAEAKGIILQDNQGEFQLDGIKNLQRFKNSLKDSDLRQIYKEAVNKTKKSYADGIGIDTENKTPSQITEDLNKVIYEDIDKNNTTIINNIIDKKLGKFYDKIDEADNNNEDIYMKKINKQFENYSTDTRYKEYLVNGLKKLTSEN